MVYANSPPFADHFLHQTTHQNARHHCRSAVTFKQRNNTTPQIQQTLQSLFAYRPLPTAVVGKG